VLRSRSLTVTAMWVNDGNAGTASSFERMDFRTGVRQPQCGFRD
jgi:hypothetical protein